MQRTPLRGVRVVLRPLEREHLARCVKWFNDPEVTNFLGRDRTLTMAEEERWFDEYRQKVDEEIYAIHVDDAHIGNIGLHRIDRVNRKADVGIVIGEQEFWSKGHGTDAMQTILRYAFERLRLHKVSLDVLDYNTRALRSYEKCGFVREGVRRDELFKGNRYVNLVHMSVLEDEFRRPDTGPTPRRSSPVQRSRGPRVRTS